MKYINPLLYILRNIRYRNKMLIRISRTHHSVLHAVCGQDFVADLCLKIMRSHKRLALHNILPVITPTLQLYEILVWVSYDRCLM